MYIYIYICYVYYIHYNYVYYIYIIIMYIYIHMCEIVPYFNGVYTNITSNVETYLDCNILAVRCFT